MTYGQVVDQYQQSQADFPLPEGVTYPAFPDGYDTSSSYQQPYGTVITFGVYECAWEKEWLQTRSVDNTRATAALDVLLGLPEQPIFQQTIAPDSQEYFQGLLDDASLGDPSGIQGFYDANC